METASVEPSRRLWKAVLLSLMAASCPATASVAGTGSQSKAGTVDAAALVETSVPASGDTADSIRERLRNLPGHRASVALVLGGGGARGAAHVGVLKVLEREGIPIDLVVGTSMGSVVGGLYAAGVPVPSIEERFIKGGLMRAFLTVPLAVRIVVTPIFDIPRLVGVKRLDGMYAGGRFAKFVDNCLPKDGHEISQFRTPFAAVALNLLDGKVYTVTKGEFGRTIQASSAVPVLRKPVLIDGRLFVDGGVTANLPVTEARQLGADIVVAVDVDEQFEPVSINSFKESGSVAHRVMTLHLARVDEQQRHTADIVIHPPVNGIGLISTKTSDLKTAVAAGESAAQASVPELKRLLEERGVPCLHESTALNDGAESSHSLGSQKD